MTVEEQLRGLEIDTCQTCGDEGFIFRCFDGQCMDHDIGCDDCTRPCPTCQAARRALVSDRGEGE